ncbi:fungal-specific transcription factor domain-containing protein [Aspergillus pseudoustus]|uniref:Fungal-specific transcription factor domain-containing protein n=1 Tax=Aspergillus pseudoustus TaxID=1810923 RepID=A0ABR4KHY4_9EURO
MSRVEQPRKRVSLACTLCRRKRVRCDGSKPVCGRCASEQEQCEYRHDEERRKGFLRPPSKHQVQALEARVRALEAQLDEYRRRERQFQNSRPQSFHERHAVQLEPGGPPHMQEAGIKDDLADLMGGLSLGEGNELRYFGSRSHLSLVEHQMDTPKVLSSIRPAVSDHGNRDIYNSLAPDTHDKLLTAFWRWQNQWQYLIHKEVFTRSLANHGEDGYCTPLLLASVFALASRYLDVPETRFDGKDPSTAGDAFARQAKALLFDEIEAPRVSTVIAAVLISLKEMAADTEPAGWTYLGIAIRMAYNLGLHIDPSQWVKSGSLTAEGAELRSIAWWGCYMVEKLFTVGIGRPSIILERDVQVPLPPIRAAIDYQPWDDTGEFSTDSQLSLSYSITAFHYACRILQMVVQPLDDIYTPNSSTAWDEKKNIMTKATVELTSFYNSFPSVLRLPSASSKQSAPPHIYCLHIHYHTLIILLYRPFISVPDRLNPLDDLLNEALMSYHETCTKSAEQVTHLLQVYDKLYSLRNISISVVDPARTAAMIHLFNMTSPDTLTQDKSKRLFTQTYHYLQEMQTAWGWAERSTRTLAAISRKWGLQDRLQGLLFLRGGEREQQEQQRQLLSSPDPPSALKDLDPYGFMEWQELTSRAADQDTIDPDLLVMPPGDEPLPLLDFGLED